MSLSKNQWYCDRLLWKAKTYHLLEKYAFDQQAPEVRETIIKNTNSDNDVALVFWRDVDLWTSVSSSEVVSKVDTGVNRIGLDEIQKIIDIVPPLEGELKTHAEYLALGASKVRIWAPHGAPLFGLIGILRMFPLEVSKRSARL